MLIEVGNVIIKEGSVEKIGELVGLSNPAMAFIEQDFRRFFPNGGPAMTQESIIQAIRVWQEYATSIGTPGWINAYMAGLAVQTINETQEDKIGRFEFDRFPVELDGDPEAEILVEARFDYGEEPKGYYFIYNWLPLDVGLDGRYRLIANNIADTFNYAEWEGNPDVSLQINDLDNNGIHEILLSERLRMAGRTSGDGYVYAWNRVGIDFIETFHLPSVGPYHEETIQSSYQVSDSDQDGQREIHVTWPRFRDFGCEWETLFMYKLEGQTLKKTVQNEDIPVETNKPECYIDKALEDHDRPAEQEPWFEVARQSLPADASPDMRAWLNLRLMAVYLGQDQTEKANQALQSIATIRGNGTLVEALRALAGTNASPEDVCKEIHEHASRSVDGSDIERFMIYGGYPVYQEIDPNKVCPHDYLTRYRFFSKHISANVNPIEAYNTHGFELRFAQSLNLDADSQMEWVAMYEDSFDDSLMILDSGAGEWRTEDMRVGFPTRILMQFAAADIDGDQQPDLLTLVKSGEEPIDNNGNPCQPDEENYKLITIFMRPEEARPGLSFYDLTCQSEPFPELNSEAGVASLVALAQRNGQIESERPSWYFVKDFPGEVDPRQDIYDYIAQIEQEIYAGNSLDQSRQTLKALIDYLPSDDIEAATLIVQSQYMIGLSYEIEGQDEAAIDAYLALIETAPDSIWSILALARLETKSAP